MIWDTLDRLEARIAHRRKLRIAIVVLACVVALAFCFTMDWVGWRLRQWAWG